MKRFLSIVLTIMIFGSFHFTSVLGQTKKDKTTVLQKQQATTVNTTGTFSYTFSKSTGTYQDLTGATSLNNGIPWDDPSYIVPMDFPFTMFGKRIDSLSFDYSLGGSLLGYCSSDSIYQPMVFPFEADLIDLGYFGVAGTSQSPLSYKVEQGAGPWNRILKIEWKNAGSYDDTTYSDYVNFQLWLYEGSSDIEIHFGPSSIAIDTVFFYGGTGPLVGALRYDLLMGSIADINLLEGTAANPTMTDSLTLLNGMPANGTIYKFTNLVASMERPMDQKYLNTYPNPVSGILNLEWKGKDISIATLYNAMGQQVVEERIAPNSRKHPLNLSGLTPGLYHLHLRMDQGHMTQTIIKE